MAEPRIQLSEDTWVYVDEDRSKIVVEIDLPRQGSSVEASNEPVRIPAAFRLGKNPN